MFHKPLIIIIIGLLAAAGGMAIVATFAKSTRTGNGHLHVSSDAYFNVNRYSQAYWIIGEQDTRDLGTGQLEWSIHVVVSNDAIAPDSVTMQPAAGAIVTADLRNQLGPADATTQHLTGMVGVDGLVRWNLPKPSHQEFMYVTDINGNGLTWAKEDRNARGGVANNDPTSVAAYFPQS